MKFLLVRNFASSTSTSLLVTTSLVQTMFVENLKNFTPKEDDDAVNLIVLVVAKLATGSTHHGGKPGWKLEVPEKAQRDTW